MSKSIYNDEIINFLEEPMFFGSGRNLQRYDDAKHRYFEERADTMESFFWRPQEISLIKDAADYKKLTPAEEFIFISNIKYQILLDSVQGRAPSMLFLPFTTNPELERCFVDWSFFETIHSKSYSHILKKVYSNPTIIFDNVLENEEIKKRAGSVTDIMNKFYDLGIQYQADPTSVELSELKKYLYLTFVGINILEGLRFYVSFACSFAFAEQGKMLGNANILKLIARDENVHLSLSQKILNVLRKDSSEGFLGIVQECEKDVYDMYWNAIQEEKDWATHLFSQGSLLGLNEKILHLYIDHLAYKRMKAIGYKPFTKAIDNPISWMDKWLSGDNVQDAPQETEITDYRISSIEMDIDENFSSALKI